MELFQIEQLTFFYPEQEKAAIQDVSMTINKGDFFVICGHSGCGKSTFLRQLKPAMAPHGRISGSILFHGQPVKERDSVSAASQIGFVMQSPESQVVTDKVWHELAFGLESLGCESSEIRRRCAEMAAFFGMEDWYYKNVSELSGGQKQLLCLASVMTMQPEILILDEPTAQLDPIAASEFIGTLGKINRELGTTILLSEHRLEEALPLANQAAVMEGGKILCCGTVDEIGGFLKSNHHGMFSAMPCAMRIWGSVKSDLSCPITVNDGREFLAEYIQSHPICPLSEKTAMQPKGEERIQASEIWFRYERELPDVVRGLEFTARAGELFCILGGNGSGKTTTLKLLGGLKKPYRGELHVRGAVGLLPQDPQTVFLKKTVCEDLADTLKQMGVPEKMHSEEISKVAKLCRISELLLRHPYDLSGGEQQRAALAKILLLSPQILLLDEPTKGLDIPFKKELAEILQKLKNRGVCIVMVSHDIEFCASYGDQCGLFFDGCLVAVEEPRSFFSGNRFYTTAANRMVRDFEPRAVTAEDVMEVIGGEIQNKEAITEKAPEFFRTREAEEKCSRLPRWRKIGAIISGLLSLAVFLYSAKSENLSKFVDQSGMTATGGEQLAFYGVFILLLALTAFFLGKRSKPSIYIQTPVEKRRLSRRTVLASVMILLLIPLTLFVGVIYMERKQYYITALAVLMECMLPFFLVFEGRKPKARELVIIATLCAMAIAGRAAFFMLPQFKPVMAVTIISGVAFGGETGFLVGAVTMLVSNILFSQGPWTPWQMFAMGIIGFLAGVLYRKGVLVRSRTSLCVFVPSVLF
ncbi:MAG: ATP-binding cassette domain-containing protein [Clostridiales bacterium]|nr:ATP-binding cassette domain-containing protein [Clostridiales bacterium]